MDRYTIRAEQFEGPLDVLLHLVRAKELDIFALDIYALAVDYLEFLRLIKFKDLAHASAFLTMAATLVNIKSKRLIPGKDADTAKDEEQTTTEEDLQERLILYGSFKAAGEHLSARLSDGYCQVRIRDSLWRSEGLESSPSVCGDKYTLLVLYEQMLVGLSQRHTTINTEQEEIKVEEVITSMLEQLKKIKKLLFQSLYGQLTSRYELVANILAILQMTRDGYITLLQNENYGPLWINITQQKGASNDG